MSALFRSASRNAGLGAFAALLAAGGVQAAEHTVTPGAAPLRAAIAAAAPGDRLIVKAGIYQGAVIVDRPLTITGEAGATIDGGGQGTVLRITAPDVTVTGFTIQHSGGDLSTSDAGIAVGREGKNAVLEGNQLADNLFGIYVSGAPQVRLSGNQITGRRAAHINDLADGIKLWNAPDALVENNRIQYGRDGIFIVTSRNDQLRANRMSELRFAVHYMYSDGGALIGNSSEHNHVGFALMNSAGLEVRHNSSNHDRDHGIALNYSNGGIVADNLVRGGGDQCVFIYNANKNRLIGNRFEQCGIGIHFTAGAEGNVVSRNAFIGNATQVKYVGTTWLEWSERGQGNYWSDNIGIDLNGDGIADTAYRPNDLVDQVVWRHPLAKLLLSSPAVQTVRWAQAQFPALHPGGVIDSAPLMQPPVLEDMP
jgi:nitrous oxidase accessory protein